MKITGTSSILDIIRSRLRSMYMWAFKHLLHLPQYKLSGPVTQLWNNLESLY